MRYFSGFCFKDELFLFDHLFKDFNLTLDEFDIVGFSYGAQSAIDYAREIYKTKRIGKIILFSPAFFQCESLAFKNMQLKLFNKNQDKYILTFLQKCGLNNDLLSNIDSYNEALRKINFLKYETEETLYKLLHYEFTDLSFLENITTFVFIGEKDLIINSEKSLKFFSKHAISFLLKDYNHILKKQGL